MRTARRHSGDVLIRRIQLHRITRPELLSYSSSSCARVLTLILRMYAGSDAILLT